MRWVCVHQIPPINYLKDDLLYFDDMSIDSCTTTKLRDYMWLFGVHRRKGGGVQLFERIGECFNGTRKFIEYVGPFNSPVQGRQLCWCLFYFSVSDPHCLFLYPHIYPSVLRLINMDQVYQLTICIYISIFSYHHTLCEAYFISFKYMTTHLRFYIK